MPANEIFDTAQTPVQQLRAPLLREQGVELFLKREDLNDPEIQGNKWLKLKPALEDAREKNLSHLLTFGGCYSNHIYATAAAGKRFGFNTTGIIRGPEPVNYSDTLKFAKRMGMQLHFVDRDTFRKSRTKEGREKITSVYGPAYIIPEGGTTDIAVNSCAEFIKPFKNNYDIICSAVGTGGTISGFIKGMNNSGYILGFPALKDASFLHDDISNLLSVTTKKKFTNWSLNNDYSFGGYAKTSEELERFILKFYADFQILLEPVYTGKMMYGLFDLIKQGYFKKGTKVLAIHTGGLQGLSGFPDLLKRLNQLQLNIHDKTGRLISQPASHD